MLSIDFLLTMKFILKPTQLQKIGQLLLWRQLLICSHFNKPKTFMLRQVYPEAMKPVTDDPDTTSIHVNVSEHI